MTDPDPRLTELYGNEQVKEANLAVAAQIAASVLGLGLMVKDKEHRQELKHQADIVNIANRNAEAMRMDATIRAMSGLSEKKAAAAGQSMAKIAAYQAGRLDWDDLDQMEKDALWGTVAGKAMGMFGKATQAVGKGLQRAPGTAQGGRVFQAGTAARKKGMAIKGRGTRMVTKDAPNMARQVGAVKDAPGNIYRNQLKPGAVMAGESVARGARAAGGVLRKAPGAVAGAAKAAPGVIKRTAAKGKEIAQKVPGPKMGWKGKTLAYGGGLGLAYGGYKGLQTGRDYMMQPAAAHQRHGAYRPVRSSVSRHGYATY